MQHAQERWQDPPLANAEDRQIIETVQAGKGARQPIGLEKDWTTQSARVAGEGQFPTIVRFWVRWWLLLGCAFHPGPALNYSPSNQTLLIHWALGSILIAGPKAWDFYERFCAHMVTLVKAYGKDILRIAITLREGRGEDRCHSPQESNIVQWARS